MITMTLAPSSISSDFQCGANFKHGSNCVIEPDVIVGDNVDLGHHVVLKSGTRFGNNIKFADYCCTTGACILGDDVAVRTKATISKSVIVEDKCFIGPDVMTNHTKHVPWCRPNVKSNFLVTRIGYGSIVGAACWIMAGVTLGSNVIVGGGTLVVKNLLASGVYVGSPPRILNTLSEEYFIEGLSKEYSFPQDIIDKYLPGLTQ